MEVLKTAEQIVRIRRQFEEETGEQFESENNNININYVVWLEKKIAEHGLLATGRFKNENL